MHLSAQFNQFNHALWVAVRCEASGASEAMPAVAEMCKATCTVYQEYISQGVKLSQLNKNRSLRVKCCRCHVSHSQHIAFMLYDITMMRMTISVHARVSHTY